MTVTRSCLTSGDADEAVEMKINAHCVENGFVQFVSNISTIVVCFSRLSLLF